MKRALVLSLILIGTQLLCAAKDYKVSSPDGRLTVHVSDGENLSWSLTDGNTLLVGPSEASMKITDGIVFGKDCRAQKVSRKSVDELLSTPHYKKAAVRNNCNELTLTFKHFKWVVRVYDDGVAYRFVSRLKASYNVLSEEALFAFPEDGKAWIPYVKQNTETLESQLFNSFENTYEISSLSEWNRERLAFLPLAVQIEGRKLCISEADLLDYPGMFLYPSAVIGNTLKGVFARVPDQVEQGGHNNLQGIVKTRKEYIAEASGPREFPWRMISVAREDKDLLDDDMVARLASQPSPDADFSWVKPGKVAWEWWNNWNITGVPFQAGVNNATYKRYIDFASDFGIRYVILDEGWAVKGKADLFNVVPEINLEELAGYARSKGVDLILWAGYLAFERDMEKACRHYSAMGIKGFKIDFMDRDDQPAVRFYEKAAEMAARYHLVVDFHGAFKPAGLQFTWPNVLNFEGVHGLEQLKWSNPEQMTYDVTMPFVRMLAGPVDYTQGAMSNANKQNFRAIYANPMSQGTRCHQLAEYVVFLSPLNMLCDSPDKYCAEPECTRFIAACPEVWDESVTLHANMGESLAVARRNGDTWYIGALTDWSRRDIILDLSALGEGPWELELFRDGANAARNGNDYVHETISVSGPSLKIHMGPGGGWAGILRRAKL